MRSVDRESIVRANRNRVIQSRLRTLNLEAEFRLIKQRDVTRHDPRPGPVERRPNVDELTACGQTTQLLAVVCKQPGELGDEW